MDRNRQTWTLGSDLGTSWEMFGKCLELSFPDYQLLNIVSWELFGNCLGIVWELFGNLVEVGEGVKNGFIGWGKFRGSFRGWVKFRVWERF